MCVKERGGGGGINNCVDRGRVADLEWLQGEARACNADPQDRDACVCIKHRHQSVAGSCIGLGRWLA